MVYAHEHGDMRKLHHGLDYQGNICGVDKDVAGKPFLYWCADAEEELSTPAANETGAEDPASPVVEAPSEEVASSTTAAVPADAEEEVPSTTTPEVPADAEEDSHRLRQAEGSRIDSEEVPSSTTAAVPADAEEEFPSSTTAAAPAVAEEDTPVRDRRRLRQAKGSRVGSEAGANGSLVDSEASRPERAGDERRAKRIHEWVIEAKNFRLNLGHPMCVEACPKDGWGVHTCFHDVSRATETLADGAGSYVEKKTYRFRVTQDYATDRVGHYCLPKKLSIRRSLGRELGGSQEALSYHYSILAHARPALLATACFAALLGFVFLCALGRCPGVIIILTLVGAVLLPLTAGCLSFWGWLQEDSQRLLLEEHSELKVLQLPSTGDDFADLAVSAALVLLGLLVAASALCMASSLRLAIGSVNAACECLMSVPNLLFEPFFRAAFQLLSLAVLGRGFAMLVACGNPVRTEHISLTYMRGVSRTFVYHDIEHLYLVLYVPIAVWVWEFGLGMGKFVLAHIAQEWYFSEYRNRVKYVPLCAISRAIAVALTYHPGTLALGAVLIPPLRLVHWARARFLILQHTEDADKSGNAVAKQILSCCTCCWACWEGYFKFMNSDAYIAVAIDSDPFFPAAHKAYCTNLYQIERLGAPNRFMWIFQMWGVLVTSGLSTIFAWCVTTSFEDFTDRKSQFYVENPVFVAAVGGLLGLIIGATFMHVLKNIADTIAFCYALDREWHEDRELPMRNNVPAGLDAYAKSDGQRTPQVSSRTSSSPLERGLVRRSR